MELDDALEAAKPLGRTQIMILVAASLMNIESGFIVLNNVFFTIVPPFHCANHSGFTLEESVPLVDDNYAKCEAYAFPGTQNNATKPCTDWVFNINVTRNTAVSDWNLVCSNDFLPGLSQSLMLAGFAIGSILGGPVADKYGKRPTILVALVIFNAIGLSVSLAQSYAVFAILRFLMGTIFKAVRIPLSNLMFEFLIPRYRAVIGIMPFVMSSVGLIIMSGIAFLVRDWRYLNLVLMIPALLIMAYSWFLPESIRWSISRGDVVGAEKTMQKVASFNKAKDFPSPALVDQPSNEESETDESSTCMKNMMDGFRFMAQLFRQPTGTVTIVLSWSWITCTLIYFGFALNTGTLAGNPYVNFCLLAAIDIPAALVAIFVVKLIGTLIPLIFGLLSSAVMMVLIIILPYLITDNANLLRGLLTAFALMGKFCITFAIPSMFLLMSDLFPTPVRNSGTSLVQLIGNFGSLSAPMLLYLNKYFDNLAFIIMILCALLAAGLCFMLPDPFNTKQLDTVKDLKVLFATKRLFRAKERDCNLPDEE